MLCDRIQNLNLNEPKFCHYCHVCNTQLNSCKQALLHCSGKRHRKKLQFLQSRASNVGQFPQPTGLVLTPCSEHGPFTPVTAHVPMTFGNGMDSGGGSPPQTAIIAGPPPPPLCAAMGFPTGPIHGGELMLPASLTSAPPFALPLGHHYHHHHHHHQQQQQFAQRLSHPMLTAAGTPPMPPPPLPLAQQLMAAGAFVPHGLLPPPPPPPPPPVHQLLIHYADSSVCSLSPDCSPLLLKDFSTPSSDTSSGARSTVISASETSSISSESFGGSSRIGHRCQGCLRQFATQSQLQMHAHLACYQPSRHPHRHNHHHLHHHHQYTSGSPVETTCDSSETDSSEWPIGHRSELMTTTTPSGNVTSSTGFYCAVCNISVNSRAQLEAHSTGRKHQQRLSASNSATAERRHSRSSSTTSSDRAVEILVDSGYVSSGGDEMICMSTVAVDKSTKFRCQVCNTFLNSPSQAKEHMASQKHLLRMSGEKQMLKRKPSGSLRRKSQQRPEQRTSETSVATLTDEIVDDLHQSTPETEQSPETKNLEIETV